MAKNITRVYLLDVPLENDYKNTLYFASASAQQTYFQSKVVKSYTDFSYQRKDNIIRIPEEYDDIYNVNYVMYQNTAYSNKWFYAFIKELKYVNDGMTEAVIETDVIQTWLFDYNLKASFIEREHVSDDTVGLNTYPENLETGDYIINEMVNFSWFNEYYIVMGVATILSDIQGASENTLYNGIYSGLKYLVFKDATNCSNMIKYYSAGYQEQIYCIFMIPKKLSSNTTWYNIPFTISGSQVYIEYGIEPNSSLPKEMDNYDILINTTLNEYTPRNNKLKCYPYNYLYITNNNGTDAVYNYEDFDGIPNFIIDGVITPGCSIKLYPTNYKKYKNATFPNIEFNYGITAGKYPTCSWTSDAYTNWLTQNGVNNAVSLGTNALKVIGGAGAMMMTAGAGTLIGGGLIASGLSGITNSLVNIHEHSFTPGQSNGNINSGDVNTSSNMNYFTGFKMSIKQEYAKIIDGFFDMFGYKVNAVKVPNTNHRARWWYTKTIDASIDGNIPDIDIQKIKDCYNSGIRFWRNATEIENYSLANGIV